MERDVGQKREDETGERQSFGKDDFSIEKAYASRAVMFKKRHMMVRIKSQPCAGNEAFGLIINPPRVQV